MADSVFPSIISAVSGLAGVAVGAWLTMFREERKEERVRLADAKYLAVLVMGHLEKLVRECVTIAWDTGVDEYGYPAGEHHDGDRFNAPTTAAPKFEPLRLDVNWKALDPNLMARILDLPGELAHLERGVASKVEDDYFPYDGEFFPHRRVLYAELAKRIADIYRDLQASFGTNPVYLSRFAELGADSELALQAAHEAVFAHAREAKATHERLAAMEAKEEEEEAKRRAAGRAPTGT